MTDFFTASYFNNSLLQWGLALLIIVAAVALARAIYWFIGKWIKRLTARTKTGLDDLMIDLLEEPFVALIILLGVRYALSTLTFTPDIVKLLDTIFTFALVLIITWFILRVYDALHREYLVPLSAKSSTDLDDQLLPVLRTGIKFIVISLGIIIALSNAGYDVAAILAGLGVVGLAFALAAQDTVSNIMGGIAMFIHRPFKMNDRITVSGVEGYVREMGLRSSTIQLIGGERVLIPNSVYITQPVTNQSTADYYYQSDRFHLHRETTSTQLETIMQAMDKLGAANPNVVWAEAYVFELGEYAIELDFAYGVAPWKEGDGFTHHLHKMAAVRSQLVRAMLKLFEQEGVKLAVPVMSVRDLQAADKTLFKP